jgi:hypothetical protein
VPNVVDHARRLQSQAREETAFAFLGEQTAKGTAFPLREIAPESLHGAVVRWCGSGCAISFGLSGDGGAFGVHLIAGGQKRSRWFGTVAELEDFLSTVPSLKDPLKGEVTAKGQ